MALAVPMREMLRFDKKYFILTALLLATEVLIASFAHDRIIRPYVGDLLAVILIYCAARSFLKSPVWPTALAVLLFAYCIELLQYFNLVNRLGLQHSRLANIIIGNSFEWIDLLAYTVGTAIILLAEKRSWFKTKDQH